MNKIAILILSVIVSSASAGDRIRLYEYENGFTKYDGYAQEQTNGTLRIYNKKGKFKGRCDKYRCISNDGKVIPLYKVLK